MIDRYLMILGMMLVTAIPRILPATFFSGIKLPPFWRKFLNYIPYTALGALIFPSILYSTDSIESALFGGTAAILLALIKPHLVLVVIGATLAVLGWELLLPLL